MEKKKELIEYIKSLGFEKNQILYNIYTKDKYDIYINNTYYSLYKNNKYNDLAYYGDFKLLNKFTRSIKLKKILG